jgi:hypothetical protein
MNLGSLYTTPLLAITNGMLAGSIALSKLATGTIGQIIIVNALGNPVYGSLSLNNLPYGTSNQFLQTSGSNNAWTTMSGDATLSSGVLTVGAGIITLAKISSSAYSTSSTSNTLVARDASGGFNAGQVQLMNGDWNTDIPSLILGQNNGLNEGVIQMWNNATTSILFEASTAGALQLYQKVNTVPTMIADISPTSSNFYTDVNLSSGHTYKVNNAEYMTTKNTNDLSEGTTNKYYSSVLAQADAKIAISSTDSTEIDFTYSAGNITAILKDNTVDISRLKTAQIDTANTANTLIKRDASGNFSAGTITCSNGSAVQGAPYSAVFGQASSTKSGQIAIIDATSANQYAQIYCRSNVLGIQGNITSIALQKNTSITGTLDVSSGINIPTGQTYKINNAEYLTTKNTNDLTEGTTNKYYSSVLAQADAKIAISSTDSTEIDFTYTSGNITAILKDNTVDISRLKTAQIDTANTAKTLVKRDINGYINSSVLNASSGTGSTAIMSFVNMTTTSTGLSGLTPSIQCGGDGVIVLNSTTNNGGSVFQTIGGHTYIDSDGYSTGTITFTPIINIGTILPVQKITIGSAVSRIGSNNFWHNINEYKNIAFSHNTSIPITVWTPVKSTTSGLYLQSSITVKGLNRVRIKVNIPLCYMGSTATNMHYSLGRNSNSTTWSASYAYDLPGCAYGLKFVYSTQTYSGVSFEYIDDTIGALGINTYNYCLLVRSQQSATVSSNLGNGSYADISCEELSWGLTHMGSPARR